MTAMGGAPLIVLDRVDKIFARGAAALAGFSLTIGQPEFVSLVGPSGCGKSTVLRLIAGLGKPSGGRISWRDGVQGRQNRREVGFVFQEPTLLPWATVEDNVFLPLRLDGVGRQAAADRIRAVLARVGLDRVAKAYPRELSGGMRMRVSVARALLTRPPVLLMDEPFAALDEITRFELNDDLLKLWQGQPWTVVFVTHSVFESVLLAQRVVVMASRPGRVAAEIIVEEPYPRGDAFRGSARYATLCQQVRDALKSTRGELR